MSAGRAKAFTKRRAHPSSYDISSFRLPLGKADQITRHIAGCEFCAAEQAFLSAYNQTEVYEPAEMPSHLRQLTEALFVGRLKDFSKGSKYEKGSALTRTRFRV